MAHDMDSNRSRTMTMAAGDASEDQFDSGSSSPSSSSSKTGLSVTVLAAASLQLLTVLCCTPAHTALAKNLGVIRAMLTAYTVHSASGDVYTAFADLVEGIVTEDEVTIATQAVAAATAQLRDMASDESLFSIEDKEFAGEGAFSMVGDKGAGSMGKGAKIIAVAKPGVPAKDARATANSVGMALTEHLCLLETACCR